MSGRLLISGRHLILTVLDRDRESEFAYYLKAKTTNIFSLQKECDIYTRPRENDITVQRRKAM